MWFRSTISVLGLMILAGCTSKIDLEAVEGPLTQEPVTPRIEGKMSALDFLSNKIRIKLPDGQTCKSDWTSASRLIACDGDATMAFDMRASSGSTVIGVARDTSGNIFAVRTPRNFQSRILWGCMDESIAYASAMAKCLKDDPDKTEEECHVENPEAASAEVACMTNELIAQRSWLIDLLRLPLPPPGPRPIPVE